MRYGRIVYTPNPGLVADAQYVNVGDIFQTLAWDLVYAQCGITPAQTVNVNRYDLRTYSGEDVLLPMNGWFGIGRGADIFPLSPRIHPLFLGYHNLRARDAQALPRDAVIGCRDEETLHVVRSQGRDAFVSGCMTLLFPPRECAPQDGKIWIVDVSAKARRAIPAAIRERAQTLSHEVRFDLHNPDGTDAEIARLEDVARAYIERYRTEAKLVITSRLHCALVCIACGVPVVLLRESFDERYAFIDRLIPLYDAREFGAIDWNPQPPDVRQIRERTMRMACDALRGAPDTQLQHQVHDFWQNRERHRISAPFMVRAYDKMRDISPTLADFIREKVLFRFTIAGARGDGGEPDD